MNTWHPPRKPDLLPLTGQTWPRLAFALHLLATTGLAVRYELAKLVAAHFHLALTSKPIRYTFRRLAELRLVEQTTPLVVESYRMAVIRLSEEGHLLCQHFGWQPVESEWERLIRLHSGDTQWRHTAAVLSMAYQARLRGWKTLVVPGVEHPSVFPDLLIEKGNEHLYVEVELRHGKSNKWRNLYDLQGFVALCARTNESRGSLVGECQQLDIPVIATDLLSLAQTHTAEDPGPLWLQNWDKEMPA